MIHFDLLDTFVTLLMRQGATIQGDPATGPLERMIRSCLARRWVFASNSPGVVIEVTPGEAGFPQVRISIEAQEWDHAREAAADLQNYTQACLAVQGSSDMLAYLARTLRASSAELDRRLAQAESCGRDPEERDTRWAKSFLEG